MSTINQLILFSKYNQLMNKRLYQAASCLTKEALNVDNKAFFKSILGTLNHIMVGDIIWLKRFAKHPSSANNLSYILKLNKPKSLTEILFEEFDELKQERKKIDRIIVHWIAQLSEEDINKCISYADMTGTLSNKLFLDLINHLFLHQVHHRGQVTTLLSQHDIDFGETDIIEIIDECNG